MDNEVMRNEENYAFDVAGYLHIPGVLSQKEVAALNEALDAVDETEMLLGGARQHRESFRDLLVHPKLVWYLNQIIGHGFRLDQAPRLLGDREGEIGSTLVGGDEPRNPSQAYRQQNGRRSCQGVKAVWALEDVAEGDGGLVVVQASHKSNVQTPNDLANGVDDMGVVVQPELKAGDLFLIAAPTLQGVRPWKSEPKRLLTYGYAARAAVQSNPVGPNSETESLPGWAEEATPCAKGGHVCPWI